MSIEVKKKLYSCITRYITISGNVISNLMHKYKILIAKKLYVVINKFAVCEKKQNDSKEFEFESIDYDYHFIIYKCCDYYENP